MKKFTTLLLLIIGSHAFSQAQSHGQFHEIFKSAENYKLDTSSAPNDKITRIIIKIRKAKGGININEAILYNIEEGEKKIKPTSQETEKLFYYFSSGDGKRLLDNAIIWIYRNNFSYNELKKILKFYLSKAGQKFTLHFPVIVMESIKAAEEIKGLYINSNQ